MAILKNNEYKTVVWGSKNNFITGLDPLGLQITSEATYATLLPGVTNLTNRIRYYGFYCWLLDFYAENIRDTNQQTQNGSVASNVMKNFIFLYFSFRFDVFFS
ncbi:MAG: hypothetical protein O2784_07570 [Proteobacteria bacterium]|nr:hypothetical protein [Bacteroidota bacterium]MDA0917156.1 hypothetical protein [Pseudomonadota bacterium]